MLKLIQRLSVGILGLVLAGSSAALAESVNFDHDPVDAPPPGWVITATGSGQAKWTVQADESAPSKPNVLKQSGVAAFPLCIKNNTSIKDGFVEVKFKALAGKEDQAAGVIWRCADKDNYYIARANALENNLTIYHTIKGKRVAFKNVDVPVSALAWHTLRVDFAGNKFTVALDRRKLIETTDDSFSASGNVGLWTKADSLTVFDDFSYGPGGQ